jgi:hypothetical protein
MSHPPYNLIRLLDETMARRDRRKIAEDFLSRPTECLSLFCRHLRARFPTVAGIVGDALQVIHAWSESAYISVDFCERSHAQMRQDLKVDARARSFTSSSNHILCKQASASHMSRGGADPAIATSLHASPDPRGAILAGVADKRPRASINARLNWQNHRLAQYKKQHARGRKLTRDELSSFWTRCSGEWEAMGAEERTAWRLRSQGQLADRMLVAAKEAAEPKLSAVAAFTPLWGMGDDRSPVPSDLVQEAHAATTEPERRARAYNDPSLLLSEAPRRASTLQPDGHCQHGIAGCYARKKNVCRYAMTPQRREEMDDMAHC